MRKIVINKCYGGFNLSPKAYKMYWEAKHPGEKYIYYIEVQDDRPNVIVRYNRVDSDDMLLYNLSGFVYASTIDLGQSIYIPMVKTSDEKKIGLGATDEDIKLEKNTEKLIKETSAELFRVHNTSIPRHDKDLVRIVEELGKNSFGPFAELEIIEIEDNDKYVINEYDGFESVELMSQFNNKNWK